MSRGSLMNHARVGKYVDVPGHAGSNEQKLRNDGNTPPRELGRNS
jgi:hypothetical protein